MKFNIKWFIIGLLPYIFTLIYAFDLEKIEHELMAFIFMSCIFIILAFCVATDIPSLHVILFVGIIGIPIEFFLERQHGEISWIQFVVLTIVCSGSFLLMYFVRRKSLKHNNK